MDQRDLTDPMHVAQHLKDRLKNIGAVFKGASFGLFSVARDAEVSEAMRTEASLMAVRRSGDLPDYPDLKRFEQTLADPKIKEHATLAEIIVGMPEFAAKNNNPQRAFSWVDEDPEDDEKNEAQPAENVVAG